MIGWLFYPDASAITSGSKMPQYEITETSHEFLNRR